MPQVEVTFDIDANGILHVSAKDKATGKEQKIRIEASSGLSDAEIDRMVKDAEKNAAEDKKRREEIDARNRLDSMTYEVEKNAKEWADKLPADAKSRLDSAVEGAKQALRGGEADGIRPAQEELNAAYSAAGATLYQGAQAQGGAEQPAGEAAAGQAPRSGRRGRGRLRDRGRQEVTRRAAQVRRVARRGMGQAHAPFVSRLSGTRRPKHRRGILGTINRPASPGLLPQLPNVSRRIVRCPLVR